jgi:hypothetical protein
MASHHPSTSASSYYILGYLKNTTDMPLVLGGAEEIRPEVLYDASHGQAPKSKSITGQLARLGSRSGAVAAKSSAQATVKLSSFESELDGATTAIKTANRIMNILTELHIASKRPIVYNDNLATINFIKGESVAKGVRHMEIRMWYTKLEYQKGNVELEYMPGIITPADKLTKLGNRTEHESFATKIQGLGLLENEYFRVEAT